MDNFISKCELEQNELELIEKIRSSNNFKIIKFGADWCAPCVAMKPEFKKIQNKFKEIDFHDIDIGGGNNVPAQYSKIAAALNMRSIPTVFLLDENNNIIHKVNTELNVLIRKYMDLNVEELDTI